MATDKPGNITAVLACGLLVAGTTLGLAGTDLVLPAVPSLPEALGGSLAFAQLVLAAYVAGTGIGILLFGELGARLDKRWLLFGSLIAFAGVSAASVFAANIKILVGLRLLQGASGAAAAVFAPGMIRALFDEKRAVRVLGFLASVESLTPALAPIAGVGLLALFGWKGGFVMTAALAAVVASMAFVLRGQLPEVRSAPLTGSYAHLLRDRVYLRYALNYAFTLGALLIFVFGAPAVITRSMGGSLSHFIAMQVFGIGCFIVAANTTGRLSERFGVERMILFGSGLSAGGSLLMLVYALAGGDDPAALAFLFLPTNVGLGFCGPLSFFQAVLASRGDDTRGAAGILLSVLVTTAAGTTLAAPFILSGLTPLALVSFLVGGTAFGLLLALPRRTGDANS